MIPGDLVKVAYNHSWNGNRWWIGQLGFVVATSDYGARIRVMIAGKTVWFLHYHLRKI